MYREPYRALRHAALANYGVNGHSDGLEEGEANREVMSDRERFCWEAPTEWACASVIA